MSVVETLVVALVVAAAAAYVAHRAWRTLRGRSCGCGSAGSCPAAKQVASDLERLLR